MFTHLIQDFCVYVCNVFMHINQKYVLKMKICRFFLYFYIFLVIVIFTVFNCLMNLGFISWIGSDPIEWILNTCHMLKQSTLIVHSETCQQISYIF
jgi:hypothetical protein